MPIQISYAGHLANNNNKQVYITVLLRFPEEEAPGRHLRDVWADRRTQQDEIQVS